MVIVDDKVMSGCSVDAILYFLTDVEDCWTRGDMVDVLSALDSFKSESIDLWTAVEFTVVVVVVSLEVADPLVGLLRSHSSYPINPSPTPAP